MPKTALQAAGIPIAWAVVVALMLVGCGGDSGDDGANGSATSASASGGTVEQMLDRWEAGDKQAALDSLLAIDWSDPPLAKDSLLKVSNTDLASEGNLSRATELAQEAHKEYFEDWLGLGQYALAELDKARAASNEARVKELEGSLDKMSEFLKRPEHLGIFQRLGPALEPLAPGEIQLPEGF